MYMPRYADGFLLAVPKRKLAEYRKISQKAGKVWKEYGALEYIESVGDDLKVKMDMGLSFTKAAKPKPGEVVVFSWILYKSRGDRDRINKKVMKDPRLANMMDPKSMPVDMKRMTYGGFRVFVDL
jgi:uncharacterized protein YbaA (DUF1428 family)